MFFVVDSSNRHAIRRLLTGTGMPASEVRNLRNGQLGKALFEAVQQCKITEEQAIAACGKAAEPEQEPEIANGGDIIASPPPPADAAQQLGALIAALAGKPSIDPAAVRKMVAEAIQTERIKPAIMEISVGDFKTSVDGESTHAMLPSVLRTINTRIDGRRLHVWMAGPSGSGKSYIAAQAAKASNLPYYSTGAIQSKYDLVGFVPPQYNGNLQECPSLMTPFRRAFQFGGVFAWDDIDASDARAFTAFNEALSNGRFAFPDAMVEQHADFVTIASANTWGGGATADYVGRNKIDGASLTRFVRMSVDYDTDLEKALVGADGAEWAKFVQSIRKAVSTEGLKVLITPRHTLQGAALLKAGMPRQDVERMTVFAGIDQATEAKIRAATGR